MKPVIALVGRPNVGKSTLFNRLTGTRDAIVADFAGLTRDRHYGNGRIGKREYIVIDTGGIGGTLAGNILALAAMRATLTDVLTEANFAKMIELGDRWSDGVDAAIKEFNLDWHCNRLGARGEYIFKGKAPRTGKEAADSGDFALEQYIHLRLLNDGFLLTPFHNMALMSPATTAADVDAHTAAFRAMCADLVG